MEKHTPHHRLAEGKDLVIRGRVRHTKVATQGAQVMGFRVADVHRVVLDLSAADFYKSMTTYGDHRVWQDVYRPRTPKGQVYLKLTVVEDLLVVSFKEL